MILFLVAVASIMKKATVFIFRAEVKTWWENDMGCILTENGCYGCVQAMVHCNNINLH
jgi:hypothetical protein